MKNKKNDKTGLKGFVYVAEGVTAVGGLLFGYDTGVISEAMPPQGFANIRLETE